jgi:tRNA G18 (ribose-2'-O)-methylase SpoU
VLLKQAYELAPSVLAPSRLGPVAVRLPDLITITEAEDPRVADYVSLRDATLRRHLESAGGLFIAEGDKVIRRAAEAGYRPRSFLLAERWLAGLHDVIGGWLDVPVYLVTESLAEQVTGFHVHRGALASFHRVERHTVADILRRRRLVILEDIVDHTNVGAILRNAAGLGWEGALLSPRTADPLYRRAIKVSMGAVFSLPWARLPSWSTAPEQLTAAGFTTVALTLAPQAVDLDEVAAALRPDHPVAIMLGTEGAGLSPRWTESAAVRARIPMTAGIDSLNVAAASAIACYVLSTRGVTGQSAG